MGSHLSSPVGGRIDGGSDAQLLNMTDRSLGKPSKCTVHAEAIPYLGDAGSAILVIVRNRVPLSLSLSFSLSLSLSLSAFPSPAMSPPSGICNVDGKRRATLLRPQITESETGFGAF